MYLLSSLEVYIRFYNFIDIYNILFRKRESEI